MALRIEETIGGAPAVWMLAIGATALALALGHPGGPSLNGTSVHYGPPPSAEPVSPTQLPLSVPPVAEIPALPKEETRPKVTLIREEIGEVQGWLRAYGFDPGPVDLMPGPRTIAAVRAFEAAHQLPETGNLDRALLEALRRTSGLPLR